jgi:GT2 family glycosyltransferase
MTDQKITVDVVVLSWNRSESTISTLQNISIQEDVDTRIWVIDQGSKSDELINLKSYVFGKTNIHLIENGKNIGVPAGRNQGMRLGHNDFIICIDNDAVFESTKAIALTIQRFQKDVEIAILGFKIQLFSTTNLDYSSWVYPKPLQERKDEEFLATRYCGAGHAIRRSCLEKTGFYDEDLFFYWEELDLSYQLINLGYKILYFPGVVVLHKNNPENKVTWAGKRYYYLVRNSIYLSWKYYRSIFRAILMSLGYLIKGIVNLTFRQAFQGIIDVPKIVRASKFSSKNLLSKASKTYIFENDIKYRGSFLHRIKMDVFRKIPN